jgi:hypothetical protein
MTLAQLTLFITPTYWNIMQVIDLIPASRILQAQPSAIPKPDLGAQLRTPITVASGDGIGPEIMQATLRILEAGGAWLAPENIHIGEQVYLSGNTSGIAPAAWDSLRRTKVFLKAPITPPLRRRLQKPECHDPQNAGLVRQCAAMRQLPPLCGHASSGHGRGDRAGKRRGSVRRH